MAAWTGSDKWDAECYSWDRSGALDFRQDVLIMFNIPALCFEQQMFRLIKTNIIKYDSSATTDKSKSTMFIFICFYCILWTIVHASDV